jgi:hypothetical protein
MGVVAGHCVRRIRKEGESAPLGKGALPLVRAPAELRARGNPEGARKRVATNADAWELFGLGVIISDQPPMHDIGLVKLVAKEPEAGDFDRVAPLIPRVGLDGEQLCLEQVAGLGAPDEYRACEGVYDIEIEGPDLSRRGTRGQLTVDRIPGLVDDPVPRINLDYWIDRLVPPVVASVRFLPQRLRRIDRNDVFLWHSPPPITQHPSGPSSLRRSQKDNGMLPSHGDDHVVGLEE